MKEIQIRGARTHNLKNINLDLPRDRLIVITGLSGSGKSSLAFDTLYAEGQRRYVESLSAYARQFLSLMEKPDVDHIEGLSPAISIGLLFSVPSPKTVSWHPESEPDLHQLPIIFKNSDLMRLNIGAFMLHTIFTASFVVIPITLQTLSNLHGNQQWLLYLPTLIIAFLLIIPCIIIAEKKRCIRKFFLSAIILLGTAEILFWFFMQNRLLSALSLLIFFFAFSLLEAFLPSLVSRTVPHSRKGTALGMYSFSQFFGIFTGGALGGWLYGALSLTQVNLFCATLALIWLAIAFNMKNPQYSTHS